MLSKLRMRRITIIMRYLALVLALAFSSSAFSDTSFDYHGIKSGMSKEEVNGIVGCADRCWVLDYKEVEAFFGEENRPPRLWQMGFKYTSDNKLWRIQLNFLKASDSYGVAQTRILTELYPDAELDEFTERGSYGDTDYVVAMLIDSDLFAADAEKLYQEGISKY